MMISALLFQILPTHCYEDIIKYYYKKNSFFFRLYVFVCNIFFLLIKTHLYILYNMFNMYIMYSNIPYESMVCMYVGTYVCTYVHIYVYMYVCTYAFVICV